MKIWIVEQLIEGEWSIFDGRIYENEAEGLRDLDGIRADSVLHQYRLSGFTRDAEVVTKLTKADLRCTTDGGSK